MSEIPDPLRNLQVTDVISITQHAAFQRPENIAEPDWLRAVEEIRSAARAIRLDVPIDRGNPKFLLVLCKAVDGLVRTHKAGPGESVVDKARLHDPVIEAVREQIGLFISVRVRLGHNKQFQDLLGALTAENGVITLAELDNKYSIGAITSTLRAIAKGAGKTAARREVVWRYIKEFLAEQTGLAKVDFPGQEFEDATTDDDLRRRLKAQGIELSHLDIVEREGRRFAQSHREALESTRAEIATVEELLPKLRRALALKGGAANLADRKATREVPRKLKAYFERKRELDEARATLERDLDVAELDPKGKEGKAYRRAVAELEEEFAEPLAEYRRLEAEAIAAEEQRTALDGFIKELEGKLETLGALETLLDRLMKVEEKVPGAASGEHAPGAVPAGGSEFAVDSRVLHRSLGPGIVLSINQAGDTIEIQFERQGAGTKTFRLKDFGQYLIKQQ